MRAFIVPSLAFALLVVHIDVPPADVLAAFALSFVLGYLVGFFLNSMLNRVTFGTLEIQAMQLIFTWPTDFLGGELVPLVFFPAIRQNAIFALPFASTFSTPL